MARMAEEHGRQEILKVLWVFAPYLQPDAEEVEEGKNVGTKCRSGMKHIDGRLPVMDEPKERVQISSFW